MGTYIVIGIVVVLEILGNSYIRNERKKKEKTSNDDGTYTGSTGTDTPVITKPKPTKDGGGADEPDRT